MIKMTEEEAINWIKTAYPNTPQHLIVVGVDSLKEAGYITRPAWEEAEEYYHKWLPMPKDTVSDYYSVINKFHDALTAAVERIKELEHENKKEAEHGEEC